jgi:hypothetical protein
MRKYERGRENKRQKGDGWREQEKGGELNRGRREENRWMTGIRDRGRKWTEGIRDRNEDGWK